nr:hypothetical protein MACL_00003452 [Theileria orientalis]
MIIYVKFLFLVFLYSILYYELTIVYSTDTSSTDTRSNMKLDINQRLVQPIQTIIITLDSNLQVVYAIQPMTPMQIWLSLHRLANVHVLYFPRCLEAVLKDQIVCCRINYSITPMFSTRKASILNRPVTPKNGCGYTSTRRQHINHVTEQPEWVHLD